MDTILIVEDDKSVRENLARLLTMEGYNVLSAIDGNDALEIINKTINIDLIVSDIMMPNLNGFELLDKVRNQKDFELVPFIFLTAKTDLNDIRSGMNNGADDYVIKPFSAEEILKTIEVRLKKQKAHNDVLNELRENIIKHVPHEMRTPLVSVLGFSDFMLDNINSITTVESEYMLKTIKKAGLRLSDWVEKFVFFTEVETNVSGLSLDKMKNISCKIKDINWTENFENNRCWSERKNDIKIKFEDANLNIEKTHLEFVIKELIENSAKFSDHGTSISAKGMKNGSYYKFAFCDKGIGFKNDNIKKIKAFKQFDRNNLQQHGNGLGLAIVNKIVTSSNGVLDLKSKLNEYTDLTINIPLAS